MILRATFWFRHQNVIISDEYISLSTQRNKNLNYSNTNGNKIINQEDMKVDLAILA